MRDCPHCVESFDSEVDFLQHLRDDHPDRFGAVDRRRLDQLTDDDSVGLSSTVFLLGGLAVGVVVIVIFVTFFLGGSSPDSGVAAASTPTNVGAVHYHGTMEMVVLGERVDFTQEQYQLQASAFHFEGGQGTVWHGHAERVTLEWAMASLGIDVTTSTVTFDGTTYDDADEQYSVSVTVNGEPVDPATYILGGTQDPSGAGQGDQIRIVVEST